MTVKIHKFEEPQPNEPTDRLDALLKKYGIKRPYCGADCGDGWLPIIEDLIQKLLATGWDRDCHQIKEKFGGLRFYVGAATEEMHELIAEAEGKSVKTCEFCGKPGERRTEGWWKTRCDDCEAKR